MVCHSLLQWIMFCQNSLLRSAHLGWPCTAWLIDSELCQPPCHDKAVIYEGDMCIYVCVCVCVYSILRLNIKLMIAGGRAKGIVRRSQPDIENLAQSVKSKKYVISENSRKLIVSFYILI